MYLHVFNPIRDLIFTFSLSIIQFCYIVETYIFDTRLVVSLRLFLWKSWWRSLYSRNTEGIISVQSNLYLSMKKLTCVQYF